MRHSIFNKTAIAIGLVSAMSFSAKTFAEDTITAVHAFNTSLIYTKSFLSFVDKLNERGKGVIQIDVKGRLTAVAAVPGTMVIVIVRNQKNGYKPNLV